MQGIRMDIVAKEAQIAQHVVAMEQHQEAVAGLLERKKKGLTLTSQQKVQVDNLASTLHQGQQFIEGLQAAIKAARAKLNGSGAHAG